MVVVNCMACFGAQQSVSAHKTTMCDAARVGCLQPNQALRTGQPVAANGTAASAHSTGGSAAIKAAASGWENLGAVLFNWDMFCAISTAAAAATGPFDTGVYWGKLDFDYLRRLELQGAFGSHGIDYGCHHRLTVHNCDSANCT